MVNIRLTATLSLVEIEKEGSKSHLILNQVLEKYQYLDKRDRAFLTRLIEGTIERQIELDYILNLFSKTKVQKMKPFIRALLRMSVYQMKYMDSVPNHAIIHEAVSLASKKGFQNLKGFVNGVLRSVARELSNIQYPDRSEEIKFLSIHYSMPEWIVKKWLLSYGMEGTEEILRGFYTERPLTIRVNQVKTTKKELVNRLVKEGVKVTEFSDMPEALSISEFDYLNALDSFTEGLFWVQDINSMRVAYYAEPKKGDIVIDVCAAPGQKAMHIAEIMDDSGFVDARDISERKIMLFQEAIEKSGLQNIKATVSDATKKHAEDEKRADIVIADLPCSGLGVLGKKTDIKYHMSEKQQEELILLQRSILCAIADYVKLGGTLVYSTCTIHTGENEENVEWFLKQFQEYKLIKEEQFLPSPSKTGDGFFVAKFVREG